MKKKTSMTANEAAIAKGHGREMVDAGGNVVFVSTLHDPKLSNLEIEAGIKPASVRKLIDEGWSDDPRAVQAAKDAHIAAEETRRGEADAEEAPPAPKKKK